MLRLSPDSSEAGDGRDAANQPWVAGAHPCQDPVPSPLGEVPCCPALPCPTLPCRAQPPVSDRDKALHMLRV